MQQWLPGHKLKNRPYEILQELGQGGFGITYKAKNLSLDVPVVIKTPNSRLQRDANYSKYLTNFKKEAKQLAKLGMNPHPHIVRVFDFFAEENLPCIVMDYVPGNSLYDLVQMNGALSEKEALEYIRQIGSALVVCHQAGIIHRDVHPNNILIHQDNGKAVLIDFGISGTTQTSRSNRSGNQAFAPWEQLISFGDQSSKTPQVDIYTLAASFYYLVTGDTPTPSLARKFNNDQLIEPRELCPGLSREINQAILKGMAILPETRPSSMPEWLALLNTQTSAPIVETLRNQPIPQSSQSSTIFNAETVINQPREIINNNTRIREDQIRINTSSDSTSSSQNNKKLPILIIIGVLMAGLGLGGYRIFSSNQTNNEIGNQTKEPETIVETPVAPSETLEPQEPETPAISPETLETQEPETVVETPETNESNNDEIDSLVQTLSSQYQAAEYQNCYDTASNKITLDQQIISDWIGKCGLALATAKAADNSLTSAISIADTIPETAANYQEAQENINLWSEQVIEYVTKVYQEDSLEEAIKVTQLIPDKSSAKNQITDLISQWQQEEENHQEIINNAQHALDQEQWQDAKQEAEKIPDEFVFWKKQAQTIINRANFELDVLAQQARFEEAKASNPYLQELTQELGQVLNSKKKPLTLRQEEEASKPEDIEAVTSPPQLDHYAENPLESESEPVTKQSSVNYVLARTLEDHFDPVWGVAISPDGQQIVSGSLDDTIKVWNLNTGELERTLEGHSDGVPHVAISPDGQRLVSGSADKTIKVWNLNTGELERTLEGHSRTVSSVVISPDGQRLVSGSLDKTIKVWNLNTGELERTLEGHSRTVSSVAISPDGQHIVSGSHDKTIKVWNLNTGELERTLEGHSESVPSVVISPDGQRLVSGSLDKTIKVWNLNTGELERTLEGHSNNIWGVAISPDGQQIVSGSVDKTIKVWNLNTGELERTLDHSDNVLSVAISPDGQRIVSGSADNTIKVWELEAE